METNKKIVIDHFLNLLKFRGISEFECFDKLFDLYPEEDIIEIFGLNRSYIYLDVKAILLKLKLSRKSVRSFSFNEKMQTKNITIGNTNFNILGSKVTTMNFTFDIPGSYSEEINNLFYMETSIKTLKEVEYHTHEFDENLNTVILKFSI